MHYNNANKLKTKQLKTNAVLGRTFRGFTGTSGALTSKLLIKDPLHAPAAITIAFLPYKIFSEVWTASIAPLLSDLYDIRKEKLSKHNRFSMMKQAIEQLPMDGVGNLNKPMAGSL